MNIVQLPYSKSEINRLFILAFQAQKPFVIRNFSFCEDTKVIFDFYQQIGVQLELQGRDLRVDASTAKFEPYNVVQVHQAGTAFRFLLSFAAVQPFSFRFEGHASLAKRPIATLTKCLEPLGAKFRFVHPNASLPLEVQGSSHRLSSGIVIEEPVPSSQFITSILLLAPSLPLHFQIKLLNPYIASESYIVMTIKMLEKLGILWEYSENEGCFILLKNTLDCYEYKVSADWTNASYFIGLSALLNRKILLKDLSILSFQPDVEQLFFWTDLGVKFSSENDWDLVVEPQDFLWRPCAWDFSSNPDLFQTFAVLTAYERGVYEFEGLQTLPFKETHRLKAIQKELGKIGIKVEYDEATGKCKITNFVEKFPSSVSFNTYYDHRMAMALSLLKPLIQDIQFDDKQVVNKSFPNFWGEYAQFFRD